MMLTHSHWHQHEVGTSESYSHLHEHSHEDSHIDEQPVAYHERDFFEYQFDHHFPDDHQTYYGEAA
jgi:hypothetical protein